MDNAPGSNAAMQDGPAPQGAARAGGAGPQAGRAGANVVAFAPRRVPPAAERAQQAMRQAAALRALDRRREAFDRYALAGQELVAELRAGRDPALAVAAFKLKVGQD